jgi:hypothetical protein
MFSSHQADLASPSPPQNRTILKAPSYTPTSFVVELKAELKSPMNRKKKQEKQGIKVASVVGQLSNSLSLSSSSLLRCKSRLQA